MTPPRADAIDEPPLDRDHPGRRFGVFALVGPVAGTTACMLASTARMAADLSKVEPVDVGAWLFATVFSTLLAAPFAYLVGMGPAMLLGGVTCIYPRRLPTIWRVAFSALLGAGLSAGFMFIAEGMGMGRSDMMTAGAGAGAFCEWLVSRRRTPKGS